MADEASATAAKKDEPSPERTRQDMINQSYNEATKKLREKYMDDFNAYRQWWLKQHDIDWSPPPSEKDKAKAELDAILAKHPDLLDALLPKTTGTPAA